MAARSVLVTLAAVAGLSAVLTAARPQAARPEPSTQVVLSDTERSVAELVTTVRDAARDVRETEPDRDLRIVFTGALPDADDRPLVAGLQRRTTLWVRIDGIAMPTRTLLHEVAHALVAGDGHGDTFRAVYLAAIAEVYDEATAAREARRLAWVYDRCYAHDTCPEVPRDDGGRERSSSVGSVEPSGPVSGSVRKASSVDKEAPQLVIEDIGRLNVGDVPDTRKHDQL